LSSQVRSLDPHAYLIAKNKEKARLICHAAKKAGYQLVKKGLMPESILKINEQQLVSEQEFRRSENDQYKSLRRKASK
jgi:hypothetical protein